MKATFLTILAFAAIFQINALELDLELENEAWEVNAWNILCKEVGTGKTNGEIATRIVNDLTMTYAPASFIIYVGDETNPYAYTYNEDQANETMFDNIHIAEGTLCSKNMVGFKISNELKANCTVNTAIDEAALNIYLDFSLNSIPSGVSSEDIILAIESAKDLGFDYMAVVATNDPARGAVSASTPNDCDDKFQSPLGLVGYFGFNDPADGSDIEAVTSKKLIEILAQTPDALNTDIAKEILNSLTQRPNNDEDWVVIVDTYTGKDPANGNYDFNLYNTWKDSGFFKENIAGKNLLVASTPDLAGEVQKCNRPIEKETFDTVVKLAIAGTPEANATFVLNQLDNGDELLGYDTNVLFVAYGRTVAISPYTFYGCTYRYQEAGWELFYYGLPIPNFFK